MWKGCYTGRVYRKLRRHIFTNGKINLKYLSVVDITALFFYRCSEKFKMWKGCYTGRVYRKLRRHIFTNGKINLKYLSVVDITALFFL